MSGQIIKSAAPAPKGRVLTHVLTRLRAPAAAADDAREPASPRGVLSPLRAGWQRLKAGHDRLSDSFLGDVIATFCFCLTAILAAIFFLAP